MAESNVFHLENTCKRVNEILKKLEKEMKKSFSHWKGHHSTVWIDHMTKCMDVFSICIDELNGWLRALGNKSIAEVFSFVFHLNRTYINYILRGYLLILEKNDNKKRITELQFRAHPHALPLQDATLKKKLEHSQSNIETQHSLPKSASSNVKPSKLTKPTKMVLFGDEKKGGDKPQTVERPQSSIDPALLGLSPHSLIERHEGILQKISDEYDETSRTIEIFLKTRRQMHLQSSNAVTNLKDTLASLENFGFADILDEEAHKLAEFLTNEENTKKTQEVLVGAQREVILKSITKYYNLKRGLMIDKGTNPDVSVGSLSDLQNQLQNCEKCIEVQIKELQEKSMKIEDLKYVILNHQETINQYKERVKAFELSVQELKTEINLYRQEINSVRKNVQMKDDQLHRANSQAESVPVLLRELDQIKEELNSVQKKYDLLMKNDKSSAKDLILLQEKIKMLTDLNDEKDKHIAIMRTHLAEKDQLIQNYNQREFMHRGKKALVDRQTQVDLEGPSETPNKRLPIKLTPSKSFDPTIPIKSILNSKSGNKTQNSSRDLHLRSNSVSNVSEDGNRYSSTSTKEIDETLIELSPFQVTPHQMAIVNEVEEEKAHAQSNKLNKRVSFDQGIDNNEDDETIHLSQKNVIVENYDLDMNGMLQLDSFIDSRKLSPRSGISLKKIILKLLANPVFLKGQSRNNIIHSERDPKIPDDLQVVGFNNFPFAIPIPNEKSDRIFERSKSVPKIGSQESSRGSIVITSLERKKKLLSSTSVNFGKYELITPETMNKFIPEVQHGYHLDKGVQKTRDRYRKPTNMSGLRSKSMPIIDEDEEIQELYDYIKQNPTKIGQQVKLLREALTLEKFDISRYVNESNISEDGKPKLKEELNDILSMRSLDHFKEFFLGMYASHKKCGDSCSHLKKFYKKIGFMNTKTNKQVMHIPLSVIKKPIFPEISGLSGK